VPRRIPLPAAAVLCLVLCGSKASPQAVAPQAAVPTPAAVSVAPQPAARTGPGITLVQDLLESLARYDQKGRPADQKLGFEIPEKALNDYLSYSLRQNPRPGIVSASVTLAPRNQISVAVEIDFDTVGGWGSAVIPEALRPMLKGKLPIRFSGQFQSGDGMVTFTLKDAGENPALGKIMMGVLQAIGGHQPESLEPTKPIPLPFGLKRIWINNRSVCGET